MYQFTEDCLIGIGEIDEEHRYLFHLINQAVEQLESQDGDSVVQTQKLLKKLSDYAKVHFEHEEAYMEKIDDGELPRQKREHAAFTGKVQEMLMQENYNKDALNEVVEYLTRWLYHHILSSDMMIGKNAGSREDLFQFSSKYYTGIEMIDREHEKLFEIIARTNEVVHTEYMHDKYDAILDILDELREYTELHFHDEEAYMEEIRYPQIEAQKRAHAAFVDKLVSIDLSELDEIDENQQKYLEELIDFLVSWLINHILNMDKKIGK